MASVAASRRLRLGSDFLLGLALGLLGYYALTTGAGWLSQSQLRDELAVLGPIGAPAPAVAATDGPALDFDGWAEEDESYWDSLADGEVFGRIVIPAIGLDTVVVKGVRSRDLKKGPGWIDWTDVPGPTGNCGIAGHRTTYGAPFRPVDALVSGDVIDFYSPFRRYRYTVTRQLVVTPDRTDVVASTDQPTLTLSACHPPYSARYRLIVQADLTELRRLEAEQ